MHAIIGGSGRLPDLLAEAAPDAARFTPEGAAFGAGGRVAESFMMERLGALVERLRVLGVRDLVLAGAMRRPVLDEAALDAFTRARLPALLTAMRGGDDALLRAVVGLFEDEGFAVIGADALAPDLLPEPGIPTRAEPAELDRADGARGFTVLSALGTLDLGQACVVAQGQALALEAAPGTDWMLASLAGEVPGRPDPRRGRGVLCKAPKPGQDRRVDLPAIGPETVRGAAAAGLGGIAVAAGGVLVLDAAETVAAADAAGLFLWVREE